MLNSDYMLQCLGMEIDHMKLGICTQRYPVVSSFGAPSLFWLERACVPYMGTKVSILLIDLQLGSMLFP